MEIEDISGLEDYFRDESSLLGPFPSADVDSALEIGAGDALLQLSELASSSSEIKPLSIKPSGRRKRVRTACDSCHERKTKCSDQRPCLPCVNAGIECKSTDSEARRRRVRSAGPRRLADSINQHRDKPCTRTAGCLRPFRHPGKAFSVWLVSYI
eukprot:1392383-Amorphochlora_amoeboformis.AAC.1